MLRSSIEGADRVLWALVLTTLVGLTLAPLGGAAALMLMGAVGEAVKLLLVTPVSGAALVLLGRDRLV